MTRGRARLAAAACGAALLAGCNAILGLGDPTFLGDGGSLDAGYDGGGGDGPRIDAARDSSDGDAPFTDSNPPPGDGSMPPDGSLTFCGDGGLLGDDENCGICGHSCLGGTCGNGSCQAFIVAYAETDWPSGLAVGPNGDLYWVNRVQGGAVEACYLSPGVRTCAGGSAQLIMKFPTATATPNLIVIPPGSSSVFWDYDDSPSGSGIATCLQAGGGQAIFGTWPSGTTGLAASAASLYTLSTGSNGVVLSCRVTGCPDGGALQPLTSGFIVSPVLIALGGPTLFWTTTSQVKACNVLTGCTSTLNVAMVSGASLVGVATDLSNVYFTDDSPAGAVYSCTVSGCPPTPMPLVANEMHPGPIATDGISIYWLSDNGGTNAVRACTLPSCPGGPRTLYTSPAPFSAIAVDPVAVYWTENTTPGHIWKMAK